MADDDDDGVDNNDVFVSDVDNVDGNVVEYAVVVVKVVFWFSFGLIFALTLSSASVAPDC